MKKELNESEDEEDEANNDDDDKYEYVLYKRSVLRRQSKDTNRNIKRLVYCRYG